MRPTTFLVILVILALLGQVTGADAHTLDRQADIEAIAERYYPNHCAPIVHTDFSDRTDDALAWAWSPLRGNGWCAIGHIPRLHEHPFWVQCSIMVHEYGHLAGFEHTDVKGDIMNGHVLTPVPACIKASERQYVHVRVRKLRGLHP